MSDDIVFTRTGFDQYVYWQTQDRKTIKRINKLIDSILRNGAMQGEGKPEALKYRPGYSCRIDDDNRLVYDIKGDKLIIISCKGHYKDE